MWIRGFRFREWPGTGIPSDLALDILSIYQRVQTFQSQFVFSWRLNSFCESFCFCVLSNDLLYFFYKWSLQMDSESFQFDLPQSLQVKLCRHMFSHHRHHYSQYHAFTMRPNWTISSIWPYSIRFRIRIALVTIHLLFCGTKRRLSIKYKFCLSP